jgi:membrane-associated phospholipid phosphatase
VRSLRIQLLVCAAAAALVRIAAYTIGPVERADVGLLEAARLHWGITYRLATSLVSVFDPLPYVLIVVALAGAAVLGGRREAGIAAVTLMVGAAATTQLLKPLLAQHRPEAGASWLPPDAWPSGHTTAAAALAFALVLVTPPGRRRGVAILGAAVTLLAGAALVALGSHYPSDILGGLCVATAWAAVAWRAAASRRARPARP